MAYFSLKIKRGSDWVPVDISPDFSFRWSYRNPNKRYQPVELVEEAGSQSFSLPATPHNVKLFNHPERRFYAVYNKQFEAVMTVRGIDRRGTVSLRSADCNTISIQFVEAIERTAIEIGNDTLKDVLADECVFVSDFDPFCEYVFTGGDPSVEVDGVVFEPTNNGTLEQQVQSVLDQLVSAGILVDIFSFAVELVPGSIQAGFFFSRITNQVELKRYLTFSPSSDYELVQCSEVLDPTSPSFPTAGLYAHMQNQISQPNNAINHQFFPVFNPNFYDEAEPRYLQYINYFNQGNFILTDASEFPVVPFLKTAFVFEKIFDYYNLEIFGTIQNDPCWHDLFELHNYIYDGLYRLPDDEEPVNRYPNYFRLCDYISQIRPLDFIRDTAHRLGYKFEFSTNKRGIRFEKYADFGTGKAMQLNRSNVLKNPAPKTEFAAGKEQFGLLVKEPKPSSDKYLDVATAPTLPDYQIGDGRGEEITNTVAVAQNYIGPNLANSSVPFSLTEYSWKIPQWWVTASTSFRAIGRNDAERTIVLYAGLASPNPSIDAYPMATNDGRDFYGSQLIDCSLNMSHRNSFFQRNMLPFLRKLAVQATLRLKAIVGKDFDPMQADCSTIVESTITGERQSYWIESASMQIDHKHGTTDCSVVLRPYMDGV